MPGRAKGTTGSPTPGEPAFLAVGKVRRPHGVAGDVLVEVFTDFPERLQTKAVFYAGETHIPLIIRRQRSHNDGILLAFDGYITPEQVGRFRNQILYIEVADAMELPEGEYYWHDIIGLKVYSEEGEYIGIIESVFPTGSNDVYVCRGEKREILLPAIADVIRKIDINRRVMTVKLLEGL